MKIYRYIADYYSVNQNQVDDGGCLVGCTMNEIKREVSVFKQEFLSTDYNPQTAIESNKHQLQEIEGHKWVYGGIFREVLDVMAKNLEFCERAELGFGALDEKYPDVWDYLFWVVDNLIREEFEETLQAIKDRDIGKVIDGACDLQVLSANLPYKVFRKLLGQDSSLSRDNSREVFDRTVNSNLRKLSNKFAAEFRPDGKVLKPVGWVPPSFDDLIQGGE